MSIKPGEAQLLAPDYYHASRGIEHLASNSSVRLSADTDEGFTQISRILKRFTEKKLPTNSCVTSISEINVLGSGFVDGKLSTSINWHFTCKPLLFQGRLGDGGTDNWSFEAIKDEVESLKSSNIFIFSCSLFVFGTVLNIIAFRMDSQANKQAQLSDSGLDASEVPTT
ncbi:MAG TPA: hypothetical protein VFV96_15130 [Verrucomicrobiae bacterium]|nr:hypothetical protein [Verrucomicrobiae bacterium]